MTDQWMLRGTDFANCNCDHGCPCQFNVASTHGHCQAVGSIAIEEGYFNETRLDGLAFVSLLSWPGEIPEGNGRCQLIIDERADEAQRAAIETIAGGQASAPGSSHFQVFSTTMTEVLPTLYAPIEISIDVEARKARVIVEGIVESHGEPIISPFTGEEFRSGIHLPHGFEYTYAEMGNGRSRLLEGAGLQFEHADSYGQFNLFHMNQDGVIRH